MYDLPSYVWALVLAGVIGILASTSIVLYRGAVAAGLGRRAATGVAAASAAVLGGWLLITGSLARGGVYQGREGGPWFGAAFAGFLLVLLLTTRIPVVSRILADPGAAARLALPHTLRVVGVGFLIVMARAICRPPSRCPPASATSQSGWPRRSSPGGWPASRAAPGRSPRRCGSTRSASSIWSLP